MGFYDFTIIVFSLSSMCFSLKNLKVLKYTISLVFISVPLGLDRFLFNKSGKPASDEVSLLFSKAQINSVLV